MKYRRRQLVIENLVSLVFERRRRNRLPMNALYSMVLAFPVLYTGRFTCVLLRQQAGLQTVMLPLTGFGGQGIRL